MSWAALFERAAAFAVTEDQVCDQLAQHRSRDSSPDDEETGETEDRPP